MTEKIETFIIVINVKGAGGLQVHRKDVAEGQARNKYISKDRKL